MPWYSKEQPTPFDASQFEGLTFLDGDTLATLYYQEWLKSRKYPIITFPSGLIRELSQQSEQDEDTSVQLFGMIHLPYRSTSDEAYSLLSKMPDEHGVLAAKLLQDTLIVRNRHSGRGYAVSYDDETGRLRDIKSFPIETTELLDGTSRALLPELYATEKQGMQAISPVKFFTPDSGWTWYATEFDGDDLFFGLVSGLEVELGYFSLSELESVRGPLGLPIERDLYYQPQPLFDLKRLHEQ